jgi:hypothetical protein
MQPRDRNIHGTRQGPTAGLIDTLGDAVAANKLALAKAARLKRKLARRKMKNSLGIDSRTQRVLGEMAPVPIKPEGGWKAEETRARKKLARAAARRAGKRPRGRSRWSAT